MKRWQCIPLMFVLVTPSFFYAVAQDEPCPFNFSTMRYTGTVQEQTRCLLRPVRKDAHLGQPLKQLPAPLDQLPDTPVTITKQQLRDYLAKYDISEQDLGGNLDSVVSKTSKGFEATYFIIHDTSTLLDGRDSFPESINDAGWKPNDLSRWTRVVTHVYINRLGQSKSVLDFDKALGSTKYELRHTPQLDGLFLAVESIQPRLSEPPGSANDKIAPEPGFTSAQLKRLALVYIASSVRRGRWLIPAYHAVIDAGIRNGHDDPQHFDLEAWAADIQAMVADATQP